MKKNYQNYFFLLINIFIALVIHDIYKLLNPEVNSRTLVYFSIITFLLIFIGEITILTLFRHFKNKKIKK